MHRNNTHYNISRWRLQYSRTINRCAPRHRRQSTFNHRTPKQRPKPPLYQSKTMFLHFYISIVVLQSYLLPYCGGTNLNLFFFIAFVTIRVSLTVGLSFGTFGGSLDFQVSRSSLKLDLVVPCTILLRNSFLL